MVLPGRVGQVGGPAARCHDARAVGPGRGWWSRASVAASTATWVRLVIPSFASTWDTQAPPNAERRPDTNGTADSAKRPVLTAAGGPGRPGNRAPRHAAGVHVATEPRLLRRDASESRPARRRGRLLPAGPTAAHMFAGRPTWHPSTAGGSSCPARVRRTHPAARGGAAVPGGQHGDHVLPGEVPASRGRVVAPHGRSQRVRHVRPVNDRIVWFCHMFRDARRGCPEVRGPAAADSVPGDQTRFSVGQWHSSCHVRWLNPVVR